MASANVEEVAADPRRDKVLGEYDDKLRELRVLRDLAQQAQHVMSSQFMLNFYDKMDGKRRDRAAEWAEAHYKPKNFAVDQPRVLAIKTVLAELQEFADEQANNFDRAWRAKAAYEGQWALYMAQFRQMEAEIIPDIAGIGTPGPVAVVESPDESPAEGTGVILHIITPAKIKAKVRKGLEEAGFTAVHDTFEGNEALHWTAPASEHADAVYNSSYKNLGEIILACWYDDPAQIEIPVGQEEAAANVAQEQAVEDGEVLPDDDDHCIVTTKEIEVESDLAQTLFGLGFAMVRTNDEGEQEWTALAYPEIVQAMEGLRDDRIIEKLVR